MGRRMSVRRGARHALLVVAAGSVGFAVGDVLTQPVAIAATSRSASSDNDFEWNYKLKPGQTLKIQGVNGDIQARPSDDGEAHVHARKHGRRSDPATVRIEVNTSDDGVAVCAIYPSRRGQENTCDLDQTHQHNDNNDVVVEFDVEVPRGVTFKPQTVNGTIEANDLDGPVQAGTVNGNVTISSSDWVTAGTVNGSIQAVIGDRHWSDPLTFGTVNGSITLQLPRGADCDLDLGTLNGNVETDFPITVSGRMNRHHLRGTLGEGGGKLKAETVNGSIRLIETRSQDRER